jgi:hypothetical protein
MPFQKPEFWIFLLVSVVIAAALTLWLIRTIKRRRANRLHNGMDADFIPAKPDKLLNGKTLSKTASASAVKARAQAKAPPRLETDETPRLVEIQPAPKRGGKTVSQRASLSVRGKTGRTAHVNISMELPEGESIRLTLESVGGAAFAREESAGTTRRVEAAAASATARLWAWLPAGRTILSSFLADAGTCGRYLFSLALILYLLTRLIGLTRFPIYFFTDEAVQTNFAADLVEKDFVWKDGETLPTFFENAGQYEMNFSVYVQIIPYLLFGKSVFVTRAVSALITLLGAWAVALILRRAFHVPLWWSGALLLSIAPVWFLHSRTAFEPGESIALYALFLYFYMRYREDSPWMLLPALVFGALSAYTYSPSQIAVAVTGALLLISDIRYHWRHKWVALAGIGVLTLAAIPYLRFLYLHPDANEAQLEIVSSYWVNDISVPDKFRMFFEQYLSGLDPRYWYLANPPEQIHHDIIRHLMKGYGHLSLWSLPFALAGLVLCLANIRSSHFRTVLIALLAAPTGGAIAQITITRTMIMVIPASLLTALGVSWLLGLFERAENPPLPEFLAVWKSRLSRWAALPAALRESLAARMNAAGRRAFLRDLRERTAQTAAASPGLARIPRVVLALALFLVLGSANVYMLWDSLTNGPTWYTNYQLYGMQYGGEQLSSALVEYNHAHPESKLIVSSSWANGTDEIYRFLLPFGFPMQTGTVIEYIQNYIPLTGQETFVMTSDEYAVASSSGRFSDIRIEQTLNYPDGQPGFYFAHLTYIPNIQEIIAAEKAELAKPVEESVTLLGGTAAEGEVIRIVHSRFDMGYLGAAFDGNPHSLIRTETANPMVLDMYFSEPRPFTQISVRVGGAPTRVSAAFYPPEGGDPTVYTETVERSSEYRDILITLPAPFETGHIRLEIETVGEGEPTHVHVYEIRLEGAGWESGKAAPSP